MNAATTITVTGAALAALLSACGAPGDEGTATSTDEGGTSAGTSHASEPSTSSSATEAGSAGDSATAATEPSTTGGCEEPSIDFMVLEDHLAELTGIAGLVAGHPGPSEAASFITAPGFEMSKVFFAGPLIETCSDAKMYDSYCDRGYCSQLFCTGLGAGWRVRTWVEPAPATQGDFTYESVDVDVTWADGGLGTSFALSGSVSRDLEDWTVTGQGTMDLTTMTVEETFAGLVPGASTVLTDTATGGVHAGALTVDGVEIAIVTPDGHLQPTTQCP